jgi:hypothetical protein
MTIAFCNGLKAEDANKRKNSLTIAYPIDTIPPERSGVQRREDPVMIGFMGYIIWWLGFWDGEF